MVIDDTRRTARQAASRYSTRTVSQARATMNGKQLTYSEARERALSGYRNLVDGAAAESDQLLLLPNSTPDHFAIVMTKLFEIAEERVVIYSNHLSRYSHNGHAFLEHDLLGLPIWSSQQIIDAARIFLRKKNSKLDIIVRYQLDVDDDDFSTHPFLLGTVETENDRKGAVTVRIANVDANPVLKSKTFQQNFVVVDSRAYRHEQHHDGINATVQFGDDGFAGTFVRVFDKMAATIDEFAEGRIPSCNPTSYAYFPKNRSLARPILVGLISSSDFLAIAD